MQTVQEPPKEVLLGRYRAIYTREGKFVSRELIETFMGPDPADGLARHVAKGFVEWMKNQPAERR